ncbi:MAG: hypothetical protein ONB25_14935, partial [candidate division KSB1 bacterium]|nr:hypothetical protein [candidate division KSB1 bacterium]
DEELPRLAIIFVEEAEEEFLAHCAGLGAGKGAGVGRAGDSKEVRLRRMRDRIASALVRPGNEKSRMLRVTS